MKKELFIFTKISVKTTLLSLAILLLSVYTGFSQTNLITNGDFEDGATGWTSWGATMTTTSDAHSGNSAVLISKRNNPWDALVKDIKNLLVNGDTYTLTAWVKIPDPAVNFRITIQLNVDGNTTYHGFSRTASPVIGSYVKYTDEVKLEWTGNLMSANMYFETESVGDKYSDYLVDDISLVLNNPPVDIIQEGKGWKDIKSVMLVGGCVTDGSKNYFNNAAAKAQVLKDCNTVTVQAYPAWGRWDENKRHVYHVDDFTSKVQEMKKQKMTVTMHMLLGWDQYFPKWYKENDFPADTLDAIMQSWLKVIITNNGNDTLVDIWNVVNEAISWDGKGGYWPLYNSNFNDACELQRMGFEPDASGLAGTDFVNSEHPVYIRKAFEYARTLTNKKLELRDSGFEFPSSSKYKAFYQLAKHLKEMNAPVDVIGFQSHLDIDKNYDWEGYTKNIKRYIALGYEVNIPEVDVGDVNKEWNDEKAEKQKLQYYKLVTAAIKGGASDFQTWGFIDNGNNSWRSGESAFPYTINFEPKPAYYGIKEALTDMSSILYWEMDSTLENIMPDVMKYNNFGTLNNFTTPEIVNGYKGKALQFDGIDDFISTGKLSDSIPGNLTFSCYIKTTSANPATIASFILNENAALQLGINQDGKIHVNFPGDALNDDLVGLTAINDNEWHFVAVQRDSTAYRLYIDDMVPVAQGQGNVQNFDKLVLGALPNGTFTFEGSVDEVKLYDSEIEEAGFMRSYAPFPPANLAYALRDLKIKLTWTDQSNNEKGFVIERKINDGTWEEVSRVNANTLVYIEDLEHYETEYSYRVRSFTSAGKSNESNIVTYLTPEDPSTGIADFTSGLAITIYPNPAKNNFTVRSEGNIDIKLLDMQGRTMLEKNNCSTSETFDINSISSGIYFIKASDRQKINVAKLIKR